MRYDFSRRHARDVGGHNIRQTHTKLERFFVFHRQSTMCVRSAKTEIQFQTDRQF